MKQSRPAWYQCLFIMWMDRFAPYTRPVFIPFHVSILTYFVSFHGVHGRVCTFHRKHYLICIPFLHVDTYHLLRRLVSCTIPWFVRLVLFHGVQDSVYTFPWLVYKAWVVPLHCEEELFDPFPWLYGPSY